VDSKREISQTNFQEKFQFGEQMEFEMSNVLNMRASKFSIWIENDFQKISLNCEQHP